MTGNDGDVSPLREAAIQTHELYEELKSAGFSRTEAMELIARILGEAFRGASNGE